MPDITGQFWVDVDGLLRSYGWTGMMRKLPDAVDSGYPPNSVVSQEPAPGRRLDTDTTITLTFAAPQS